MQIALYQPDIPQNLGSILRLCACLGVPLHVIEPCGFILDDKRLQRVAMDYTSHVSLTRHISWEQFLLHKPASSRLLLLTTKATQRHCDFSYQEGDILLLGRESAGVPPDVAERADARLLIPLTPPARSLNVVQAATLVLGEGLRQTRWQA